MKTYLLSFLLFLIYTAEGQEIMVSHYQLDNGLTVILNEDHSQPTVFGCVVVRAGSKDDPEDATGLAHYMEHVMFKGTQELGTEDWENEKPHYLKIIDLYEVLRSTNDPDKKKEIYNQINDESILAGQYAIPNEFSNMVQGIGGTGLNAGTSYDFTMYYNAFPPFQVRKWLDLYAHRFVNPVFRGFQSELETVYEEKNMYSDNPFDAVHADFMAKAYGSDNPYGRVVIGETEHLKNPSIKRLIEFYDSFYVPSNMALILSGDINVQELKPMIEETFGQWVKNIQRGENKKIDQVHFNEALNVKAKLTPYPMLMVGYPTIPKNNPDEFALEFCIRLLSNKNYTGLLDKLVIDGDLLNAGVNHLQQKYSGLMLVQAIPTFDVNQMKFVSLPVVEKMVDREIEKLKNGEFEDWIVVALQSEFIREYEMLFESPFSAGIRLTENFIYEESMDGLFHYKDKIKGITKEDIVNAAKKYFADNRLVYISDIGKPQADHLEKPDYRPVEAEAGGKSKYATYVEKLPMVSSEENYVDFANDIKEGSLAEGVKLFYTPNPKNGIFSLTIKFGIGTGKMPTLGMAAQLMNYAGVMAQYKPQELKQQYSRLGCSVNFYSTDSYLYLTLEGYERNLAGACQLLSRTFLFPQLDEKQKDNVIGSVLGTRSIEKNEKESQARAIRDYLLYGINSPEITRLPTEEIRSLTISNLTGDFIKATHYEASVHYVGKLPFAKVTEILKGSLALPSNLQKSDSPYIRPFADDEKESILFLHNPDARQSEIFLFIKGSEFKLDDQPVIDAFNQYFGGGFNGIVLQELREKNSFAYTAEAHYQVPPVGDKGTALIGYIGTQSDKTAEAVVEFMKLIKEMPMLPERTDNIRNYLVQSSQAGKPGFRNLSQIIESWRQKGYTEDPYKRYLEAYRSLTFDDIASFYKGTIAGQPVSIAIVGNKQDVDMKKLSGLCKIVNISTSKIFKD